MVTAVFFLLVNACLTGRAVCDRRENRERPRTVRAAAGQCHRSGKEIHTSFWFILADCTYCRPFF